MTKLACFGSCCIDYYTNLNKGTAFAGGGPVNTAVHCAQLGLSVSLCSAAGSDAYGSYVRRTLQNKAIDLSHFYTLEGSTAFCEVCLAENDRILGDYEEGVMESFRLKEEDIRFLASHDILLTDLWGNQTHVYRDPLLRAKIKAFDSADRLSDPAAQAVIPYTDILFFSSDDTEQDTKNTMLSLQDAGPSVIVAMRGIHGSLCLHDGVFTAAGIVPVRHVTDTMGAGDSYIAGFLYAFSNHLRIEECMRLGARTASETLTYYGAFQQEGKSNVYE